MPSVHVHVCEVMNLSCRNDFFVEREHSLCLQIRLPELQMYLTVMSVKQELALGHSQGLCCMLEPSMSLLLKLMADLCPHQRYMYNNHTQYQTGRRISYFFKSMMLTIFVCLFVCFFYFPSALYDLKSHQVSDSQRFQPLQI